MQPIFDAHLDLSMNALQYERDQTLPLAAIHRREAGFRQPFGIATTCLPELRRAGVVVCVATLLARAKLWVAADREPSRQNCDYPDASMAHAVAQGQLAYYQLLEKRGEIRMLRTRDDLQGHLSQTDITTDDWPVGVILTMEGADPVTEPEELVAWHAQGLRTLMFAHFGQSRYAGGTPSTDPANTHDVDGPLTDRGRALLDVMASLHMPLDLSHLSDQSFAESVERFGGPIYASHNTCRALVPGNPHVHPQRMLTDPQIQTIVARGGIIGLPLFNAFLKRGYTESADPDTVTFEDVADHVDHICQLAGSAQHVAIGSDADGGFGSEHCPKGFATIADLHRICDPLMARGYREGDIASILCGNWQRFFMEHLPA